METRKITFPWNMERDKRNPSSSLPGADLVGFIGKGTACRFVFGEVKSSSEKLYPPQIMSGRNNHLGHQLDNLASDLTAICQLLLWLLPRVKGNKYEEQYNQAAVSFFNSGNKNIALLGKNHAIASTQTQGSGIVVAQCIFFNNTYTKGQTKDVLLKRIRGEKLLRGYFCTMVVKQAFP